MFKISSLLFGVILGGVGVWYCVQHHIVRTSEGFTCVPKQSSTLSDTYVDVRDWGFTDWAEHPDLALSLSQNGHKDLVGSPNTLETTLKGVLHMK